MKALAEYQAECQTFQMEAAECEKKLEAGTTTPAWYSSPWMWLAVGIAAGSGITIAAMR
jgi:uncharacterized membrane protein YjjP (DUF1212 family)